MQTLWAERALTADGWAHGVCVEIGADGRIDSVTPGAAPAGRRLAILLPAPVNLHSHAFQRAMAGLTERRGPGGDSFWTWRRLMYRFLATLTPEDVEAIAAYAQMEMLEAGFAALAEFHYLHHQPDGTPYDDLAEMAERIAAAAEATGIGLTLLPVLYQQGGCDGRALGAGQVRFGNDADRFARLLDGARAALCRLPADAAWGVAPHSLRAVGPDGIRAATALCGDAPFHMHLAEQMAEVEEVRTTHGRRPVELVLDQFGPDPRWCLIHCTQMEAHETRALAATGATVGVCPVTESSLGDGIFDGPPFVGAGGRVGVGSDSNIRVSLVEELRTLEYSQRLRDHGRAVMATAERSTGRHLFETALAGGAAAADRATGRLAPGAWADIVALDGAVPDLAAREGDTLLDTWIFASGGAVRELWSAGRHVVSEGRHVARETIAQRYADTLARLEDGV